MELKEKPVNTEEIKYKAIANAFYDHLRYHFIPSGWEYTVGKFTYCPQLNPDDVQELLELRRNNNVDEKTIGIFLDKLEERRDVKFKYEHAMVEGIVNFLDSETLQRIIEYYEN